MPPEERKLYPPAGVYASRIRIVQGEHACHVDPFRVYNGITNIGDNPTVNDKGNITIETNIFDFDRDIYGQIIKVELIEKIRGEKKFGSLDELKAQMTNDIENSKRILGNKVLVK
jgi:riboflavin kinase/FMN adenylyltransferase